MNLRIVLTLEYVSNTAMNPFLKFVSNMKDSIAYFGFKMFFKREKDKCMPSYLAAGTGTRLRTAHNKPKILLNFNNKSLLERHITNLN